jgi:hypothetical protein
MGSDTNPMGYRLLANGTMLLHFVYLAYVLTGGFLAWRWPRAIWPHLALAGWGFSTIVFNVNCPLTYLEDQARRHAGQQGLPHGFIDRYLTGVVYPQRHTRLVQLLAATTVQISWIGVLHRHQRRYR